MADQKVDQTAIADALFPVREARRALEDDVLNVPLNERRLHTETYDFTVSTIRDLLKDDQIKIPEFQRKYVWTRRQASKLIESLIIQCPIPVIYLDQEDDGSLIVIDGNQRLMSISLFLDNRFKLQGLTAFPDLNGLRFRDLDPRFRNHIINRTLRCITILKETHPQIKFDVFERLNTGSVQLNAQELRHGLYHGPLMELLDKLGEDKLWKSLTGIKADKRMRGSELILRFLALSFDLDKYEKPLADFLNRFARENKNAARAEEFKVAFREALAGVKHLFAGGAFRLFDEKGEPENNLNAAVFDAQMVGIARSKLDLEAIAKIDRKAFLERYKALQNEEAFNRAVTASTSDPPLVARRIRDVSRLVRAR